MCFYLFDVYIIVPYVACSFMIACITSILFSYIPICVLGFSNKNKEYIQIIDQRESDYLIENEVIKEKNTIKRCLVFSFCVFSFLFTLAFFISKFPHFHV